MQADYSWALKVTFDYKSGNEEGPYWKQFWAWLGEEFSDTRLARPGARRSTYVDGEPWYDVVEVNFDIIDPYAVVVPWLVRHTVPVLVELKREGGG